MYYTQDPITTNHIYLATKTMNAIEEAINKDQGSKFRELSGIVLPHIGDAYSPDNTPFRSHMGASVIGGHCAREIWYSFRWFTRPNHTGRLLRLFNRGHLEEGRFIAALLTIGCQVFQQDSNGKQFKISASNGHFGGSGDGIVYGIPDCPEQYMLCEFKTHGEKSFTELKKKGVAVVKPEHVVQMNIYMEKMKIPLCLYGAVNKNTDELYFEIIIADKELAIAKLELADTLIAMQKPPDKISKTSAYYKCRFCDHRPVCFFGAEPDHNCRTCVHSQPIENAEWICGFTGEILTKEKQLVGCDVHNSIK
jgi:hypothetical protein